jgi:hypothetical protein
VSCLELGNEHRQSSAVRENRFASRPNRPEDPKVVGWAMVVTPTGPPGCSDSFDATGVSPAGASHRRGGGSQWMVSWAKPSL